MFRVGCCQRRLAVRRFAGLRAVGRFAATLRLTAALRFVALRLTALRFVATLRLTAALRFVALRLTALRFVAFLAVRRLAGFRAVVFFAVRRLAGLRAVVFFAVRRLAVFLAVLRFAGGTVTTFRVDYLGCSTRSGEPERRLVHGGLEVGTSRELHALGSRDLYWLAGARIAPHTGLAVGTRPSAETGNRDFLTSCDGGLDTLEQAGQGRFGILLADARPVCDLIDELLLVHAQTSDSLIPAPRVQRVLLRSIETYSRMQVKHFRMRE
jgi:hypothetical protein